MEGILEFIFSPDEKRVTDIELEETFVPEDETNPSSSMSLMQRIKHETKSGEHAQHEAIRVNLVSRLLDEVDELSLDSDEDMSFGEKLAYNTLFHYGFVKEI